MMKSLCLLALLCFLHACKPDTPTATDSNETKTVITHDTIPETRDSVSKKPVASYTSTKGEKLKVDVYQTKQTFRFVMQMKYKFLDEPDTLRIPNIGIRPTIVIKGGDDKQSCTIGFLDKEGTFKEYKLVTVKTGNLQVKVIRQYVTRHYKTVYNDTLPAQK